MEAAHTIWKLEGDVRQCRWDWKQEQNRHCHWPFGRKVVAWWILVWEAPLWEAGLDLKKVNEMEVYSVTSRDPAWVSR